MRGDLVHVTRALYLTEQAAQRGKDGPGWLLVAEQTETSSRFLGLIYRPCEYILNGEVEPCKLSDVCLSVCLSRTSVSLLPPTMHCCYTMKLLFCFRSGLGLGPR